MDSIAGGVYYCVIIVMDHVCHVQGGTKEQVISLADCCSSLRFTINFIYYLEESSQIKFFAYPSGLLHALHVQLCVSWTPSLN